MKKDIALKRYLERHIEPGLPHCPVDDQCWRNVLVIPAYDESPKLLDNLSKLKCISSALVILVLNRPDSNSDTQTNTRLRAAVARLPITLTGDSTIYRLNDSADLFLYDLEQLSGPTPKSQGVGLARKVGCDIALLWQSQGAISSPWIHCSDADAHFPRDYFTRTENLSAVAVAAIYPFVHTPGKTQAISRATALVELRLHHYVLGLQYANSPYAYHTIGSCITFTSRGYTQVRGYPKRSGGEDFYLLNKLAKTGPIISLSGECIALQSRLSSRVPFGTGPATNKVLQGQRGDDSVLFYHPQCFEALKIFLISALQLKQSSVDELQQLLVDNGLETLLAKAASEVLGRMDLPAAINHCRTHGKSNEQFLRHFHQWFDGFKSLKFIHGIRDSGWPMQNLRASSNLLPQLLPTTAETDIQSMRSSIRENWGWVSHTASFSG